MKLSAILTALAMAGLPLLHGAPALNDAVFGKMLGGWEKKRERAADYEISGASYRTWKPDVTPTVDGGLFVSMRIDHLRGTFASDDHAILEISFDPDADVATARSTIAIQGRKITSDLIRVGSKAGTELVGVDRAVKVGTDLVADLTSKLLRENISEPGRVGFPAALRHNYNLLCLAVRDADDKAVPTDRAVPVPDPHGPPAQPDDAAGEAPAPETGEEHPDESDRTRPAPPPLDIQQQNKPKAPKLGDPAGKQPRS